MRVLVILLVHIPFLLFGEAGERVFNRPLAQDFVVLARSSHPKTNPLHNPMLVVMPNGRLVAGYTMADHGYEHPDLGVNIYTSDDRGLTWQHRRRFTIVGGLPRLVVAKGIVYIIGSAGTMRVAKSTDNGTTWTVPKDIVTGPWHQSATSVIRANGNIYLATEKRIGNEVTGWKPGELSPVLMRARETDDLRQAASWTFSQPSIVFKDLLPGYREDNLPFGYFAVPFFRTGFPDSIRTTPAGTPQARTMAPVGWLEGNVVQIIDPKHPWYDAEGKTFHILMRAHTGGTGYAALAKVREHSDGSMTASLETSPSGGEMLFIPMPGGHMRFHICYDEPSRLYWLLGSQSTDSMTRSERLPGDRYDLPNNERHRMVLHFSADLIHWQFAGLVAIGGSPKEARHYAAMDIDGDDLVILSRSGDEDAKNPHDGNLITFHRIGDFRSLVY